MADASSSTSSTSNENISQESGQDLDPDTVRCLDMFTAYRNCICKVEYVILYTLSLIHI